MTISTTESRIEYLGNGATKIFAIPFRFLENSHVVVTLVTAAGAQVPQSQGADYVLAGADEDTGGFLTMTVAPPVSSHLIVLRVVPATQETDYISGDPFPAESHERALDKLTMLVQQGEEVDSRTLKFPVGDLATQVGELPPAADRANRILSFDALGKPSVVAPDSQSAAGLAIALAQPGGSSGVGFMQEGAGAVLRTVQDELRDRFSVRQFGAECDWNGVSGTDDTAAFQAVCNAVPSGKVWDVFVPASARVTGVVAAGAGGVIAWNFAQGAVLAGGGTLPFHATTMSYNSSPNTAKNLGIWHGTNAKPTTDGTVPTVYLQRVDRSTVGDNPANLISTLYTTMKRLVGGTGWLYSHYAYLEDASNTGAAQSVAVAGAAHATGNGSVWGLYGEASSHNANANITGAEFDAFNYTGSDYPYNATFPTTYPFSCGAWVFSGGSNKNSFGIGIGSSSIASMWKAGIYMKTFSVAQYAIDIHAQPSTLINFKYGASTDGTGLTVGGIGLDCGAAATYGTGVDQGAIHLRQHRLCFGAGGHMVVNGSLLEFWSAGARRGYIDLGGTDHAL